MFKNLIKVNHDGILITQNDQIIFFNQQINKIFDIPNIENQLIEEVKKKQLQKNLEQNKDKPLENNADGGLIHENASKFFADSK